jgi:predicted amidohydrolase
MTAFKAACIQMRSSDDVQENIRDASNMTRAGAQFIATPENTTLMAPDGGAKLDKSCPEGDDPALPVFRALAQELNIWLMIGSLAIRVPGAKTANRSFLIDSRGGIVARIPNLQHDRDFAGP